MSNLHVTGVEVMGPHFTKYHLSDHGVIHKFTERDVVKPHNHPFGFTTEILWGRYAEELYVPNPDGTVSTFQKVWGPGTTHRVEKGTIHLLVDLPDGECWTHVSPDADREPWGFYDFRPDGVWFQKPGQEWILLIPKT